MRDDEKKLWNNIWEQNHSKGVIPIKDLVKKQKMPLKRAEIILQRWLGLCLINCGKTIWQPWIEKGVKQEDLENRRKKNEQYFKF